MKRFTPGRSSIDWWTLYHNLLSGEFRPWTPDQIGKLTPTQLNAMGHAKPPAPNAITTAEQYEAMLARRERERQHWEMMRVQTR